MEEITIEKRKLDCLLRRANISNKDLDFYFKEIDRKMKDIKIGDKVYEIGTYGDVFEKIVIRIVDKDNGTIETQERSINKTEIRNILSYCDWTTVKKITY